MKITNPKQTESGTSKLEEAVNKFETQFKEKDQTYYHLVIEGEYNREVCDKIELLYLQAGWSDVICKTSTENGERGGLTGLRLRK